MAKQISTIQIAGKLGTIVGMKGRNGKNYARERVDNINNPRTTKQMKQRGRVNLAGQLSSIVPAELITGFGMNKADNRNAFMKNAIKRTESTIDMYGKVEAVLLDSNIIFSKGNVAPITRVSSENVQVHSDNVVVTFSPIISGKSYNGMYGVRVVVIVTNKSGDISSLYEEAAYTDAMLNMEAGESDTTIVTVPLLKPLAGNTEKHVAVYYIPFRIDNSNGSLVAQQMLGDGTAEAGNVNAILELYGSEAISDWGDTYWLMSQDFTNPE